MAASPRIRLVLCLFILAGWCGLTFSLLGEWASPVETESASSLDQPISPGVKPAARIEPFDLPPSGPSLHRLVPGVVHQHRIYLKSGYLLEASVDQDVVKEDEIDVLVRLYEPSGAKLFEIDSPNGKTGKEEICLVARETGHYLLEVDGGDQAGTYRMRLKSLRPATTLDRTRAAADRIYYRGRDLGLNHPSRYPEAVRDILEAERLWEKLGDRKRQVAALTRAGKLLYGGGEIQRAREIQEKTLDLVTILGDREGQVTVLNALGGSSSFLEEAVGEDYRLRALELARRIRYKEGEADALMALSGLLIQKGQYWQALQRLNEALPLWRQTGQTESQINAITQLGMIHDILGNHQHALDYYEEALRFCRAKHYGPHARVLSRISELYEKLGRPDRALLYSRQALELRKKAGDVRGSGVSLVGVGMAHRRLGNYREARNHFGQALSILRKVPDPGGEASTLINLGWLEIDQGNATLARRHFQEALPLLQGQKLSEAEAEAFFGLAKAERLRGNPIQARTFAEKSLEIIERTHRQVSRTDLQASYMSRKQSRFDFLIGLLVRDPARSTPQADVALAFETTERARSRSFLQSFSPSVSRSSLIERAGDAARQKRREIEKELAEVTERLRDGERAGRPVAVLRKRQRDLMERLRNSDTALRLSDPWYVRLNHRKPVSLSEAQQLIDENTLLIDYHLGNERSLVWVVSPTSAEVFSLPARGEIEEQVRKLHRLLAKSRWEPRSWQASIVANKLSEVLLGPFAERLGHKRLVIVPDGALHYLPIGVLPEPFSDAPGWSSLMMADHEVVYLPSVSVLKALREEAAVRPSGSLAIFADPVFAAEEYQRLHYSRREAESILSMLPRDSEYLSLWGADANKDVALSGRLVDFRILHFATHGIPNTEHPELSAVLLSQTGPDGRSMDGYLTAHDIQGMDLRADLVVLSACSTALGREVRGEGLIGLTQAFMHAGADRVVVSLWDVNDESTAVLMERFYRGLILENKSPAEALRTAQIWMSKQPRWSSPYYWGGFVLQGEWH